MGEVQPLPGPVAAPTSDPARVLVVDDEQHVRESFAKVLDPDPNSHEERTLSHLEEKIFGPRKDRGDAQLLKFDLRAAANGGEAVDLVQAATRDDKPFSVAFIDICLPTGPDGIETASEIWAVDPNIEIVICSAHSTQRWADFIGRFGLNDQLLILRKPFDPTEMRQLTLALWKKWLLRQATIKSLTHLSSVVEAREAELAWSKTELEREVAERLRIEAGLRHAQKLEAVGQLAAGVAHEINTPVQFVGDSICFLQEAVDDVLKFATRISALLRDRPPETKLADIIDEVATAEEDADLEFIQDELPGAFERTTHGIERVTQIVRAMKGFARQDVVEKTPSDVNEAISNTLIVARNEYKYVADVDTQLRLIPLVECHIGDLNQVFLNLIVNAAHAIELANADSGERGHITVETEQTGETVSITITDDGSGIPEEIRRRIFDPFFTTKPVGKGTGQGLAICHAIVLEHGGTLQCDSEVGRGTSFTITLPINAEPAEDRVAS